MLQKDIVKIQKNGTVHLTASDHEFLGVDVGQHCIKGRDLNKNRLPFIVLYRATSEEDVELMDDFISKLTSSGK